MEWISAKDRLPEENTEVLCYQPEVSNGYGKKCHDRILMGYLFCLDPGERTGNIDFQIIGDKLHPLWNGGKYWAFPYICHQNFVTHWMPLPQKPITQVSTSDRAKDRAAR